MRPKLLTYDKIMTEFRKLDVTSLIGVICASDYLAIPILIESVYEVVQQSALEKVSWEELEELPFHIRNQIIVNKLVMLLGPVHGEKLALFRGHENQAKSVCVTQDDKVVSGSGDNTVRVGIWRAMSLWYAGVMKEGLLQSCNGR